MSQQFYVVQTSWFVALLKPENEILPDFNEEYLLARPVKRHLLLQRDEELRGKRERKFKRAREAAEKMKRKKL